MRIIGGQAGGRLLKVPKGLAVRPTPDLVKQAIFNSLGGRTENATVLELFGGSGALSLESLSRGAAAATIVEKSAKHARMILQNFESLGWGRERLTLRVQDAFQAITQLAALGRKFDLVFADPPYGEKNTNARSVSFAQKLLDDETLPELISPDGLFILGHSRRDRLELPARWSERKQLKHGDSIMRFLERPSQAQAIL